MKHIFLSLIVIASFDAVVAQPDTLWTWRFGTAREDVCYSLKATADGGFVMAGTAFVDTGPYAPPDSQDILLVRVDSAANEIWSVTLGGSESDVARDLELTSDGGYLLAGSTGQWFLANSDIYVIRTDSVGTLLWDWRYGGWLPEYATNVETASGGGFFVCGDVFTFDGWGCDIWVAKLSEEGVPAWMRIYGVEVAGNAEQVVAMKALADGGFILAGTAYDMPDSHAVYLMRANGTGDTLWTLHWSADSLLARPTNIAVLPDAGGYAIIGAACDHSNCVDAVPFLLIVTEGGEVVEEHVYPQSIGTLVQKGIRSSGQAYLFAGSYINSGPILVRCAVEGGTQWVQNYHWNGHLYDIVELTNRSYVAAGDQFGDFYLLKTQPDTGMLSVSPVAVPADFSLASYPNPFNSIAVVVLLLPTSERTILTITDLLGRHVATLHDGMLEPGEHRFTFDGSNLPSGIYFARVQAGEFVKTQKLLLLK